MRDASKIVGSPYYVTKKKSKNIFWGLKSINHRIPPKRLSSIFSTLLSIVDSSLRSVLMAIIGNYQRHLSPRKGYSCAHRILHGGDSCSQYVKQALADKSLFEATLLAKERFRDCHTAYVFSRNRSLKSKDSAAIVAGPPEPTDPVSCIVYIIFAILSLIFGRQCCNNK